MFDSAVFFPGAEKFGMSINTIKIYKFVQFLLSREYHINLSIVQSELFSDFIFFRFLLNYIKLFNLHYFRMKRKLVNFYTK